MKKITLGAVVAAAMMFAACNSGSTGNNVADNDSILVEETLEQEEIDQMTMFINELSAGLDSIQIQEHMIYKATENGDDRTKILEQVRSFKELLAKKQQKIDALIQQNNANKKENEDQKVTIQNLQKIVDYLNAQLAEKTAYIEKLEELLKNKDASIDELRFSVSELSQESEYLKEQNFQQDKAMNTAYYLIATKKELKESGVLKSKKINGDNINKELFKKIDVRGVTEIAIDSKNPTILSGNPASSYTLRKNADKTTTLIINDVAKFWSMSPYLVIEK